MRSRVDKLGVAEPEIRKQGTDQIVIELAGVHDQARAADIIGKTAQLQFYDLEGDLVGSVDLRPGLPGRARPLCTRCSSPSQDDVEGSGLPTAWYLYGKDKSLLAGPAPTKEEAISPSCRDGKRRRARSSSPCPANRIVVTCSSESAERLPGLNRAHRLQAPTTTCSSTTRRTPSSRSPR